MAAYVRPCAQCIGKREEIRTSQNHSRKSDLLHFGYTFTIQNNCGNPYAENPSVEFTFKADFFARGFICNTVKTIRYSAGAAQYNIMVWHVTCINTIHVILKKNGIDTKNTKILGLAHAVH